jgi:N-acetylglucosamine kinase-like BadF-type ATPase
MRAPSDAALIGLVDLGKTSCRLRVIRGTDSPDPVFEGSDSGSPGLADAHGVSRALEAVERVLRQFHDRSGLKLDALVVGAAGTEASKQGARDLAASLRQRAGCEVVVASDVLIAHVGAFDGGPGTVLVAGTGSVALGLDPTGRFAQADGWGPWLGDEGSGRWIGQHGLQAALRSVDGRGPQTTLAGAMRDIVGEPHDVPAWVARGDAPARTLGTFALVVIDHARTGDPVAIEIVEDAVARLARAARAASAEGAGVVVTGGLVGNGYFGGLVTAGLEAAGLRVVAALGSALDGAHRLATDRTLAHESKVFRAE